MYAAQPVPGGSAGAGLRLSPSPPVPAAPDGGCFVRGGDGLVLALAGVPDLPGRSADRVFWRTPGGLCTLGQNGRQASGGAFQGILEDYGRHFPSYIPADEKNFTFYKNFVCIWGKMGYNKMELPSTSAEIRRYIP